MSHLWAIALKLLGLQCPSFAQRYPYILSWEWLWSFGRPHSTAKVYKKVPPFSNKMIKICNSGYAQKSPYWDLTFLGIRCDLDWYKKFHFGDFYFSIFFKYRHNFNTQGGNHPPFRGSFGPAKDLLEDFLCVNKGGWEF